ncbi:MAG: glycosyltransferase [Rickettsiales bacterium]|nr:MAG: glycosyltransferase [Rickettsiales bacterium]
MHEIITKQSFDIIQIDHLELIELGYFLPKNIKKIFVHHELLFGRLESSLNDKTPAPYEQYILNSTRSKEVNLLNQFDGIFVFSDSDKDKLLCLNIKTPVFCAPFPVSDENFVPIHETLSNINKIIFLGGEAHAPNKEAVSWYMNEVAPLIKQFSDLKLHVIGSWEEKTVKKYVDNSSIVFSGFVEDLITYCKNSVMVVPLLTGSGIRTKILYAMAQGVPVISTSIGCEGIKVVDSESIIVANTAFEFAEKIKLMLNNLTFLDNIRTRAQAIARENYSQESTGNLRLKLMKTIINTTL